METELELEREMEIRRERGKGTGPKRRTHGKRRTCENETEMDIRMKPRIDNNLCHSPSKITTKKAKRFMTTQIRSIVAVESCVRKGGGPHRRRIRPTLSSHF